MRFIYSEDEWGGRLITAPFYVVGFALYFLRPLGVGLIAPLRSDAAARRRVSK
jgi:hypothetical protein